jgi:hypothetical protein
VRTADIGEYTVADLAELFTVSRATVYRNPPTRYGDNPHKTGDKPFAYLRRPSDAACSFADGDTILIGVSPASSA